MQERSWSTVGYPGVNRPKGARRKMLALKGASHRAAENLSSSMHYRFDATSPFENATCTPYAWDERAFAWRPLPNTKCPELASLA